MDGNTLLDGTVLVCINKAWGTVCDNRFSQHDAEVVCRSNTLGLKFNGEAIRAIKYLLSLYDCVVLCW